MQGSKDKFSLVFGSYLWYNVSMPIFLVFFVVYIWYILIVMADHSWLIWVLVSESMNPVVIDVLNVYIWLNCYYDLKLLLAMLEINSISRCLEWIYLGLVDHTSLQFNESLFGDFSICCKFCKVIQSHLLPRLENDSWFEINFQQ